MQDQNEARVPTMTLPPILPSLDERLDAFLSCPERLDIHARWTGPPRFWERTPRPRRLLKASATKTQPLATTLEVRRDPVTGKVSGFVEVPVKGAGDTAKNSTSMARRPGPPDQVTRGSSTNYPFKPGGFDDAENELMEQFKSGKAEDTSDVWRELNDRSRFIKVPPGFDRGYEFPEEIDATAINEQESKDDEIVNLTTLMAGLGPDTDPLGIWTSVQTESDGNEKSSGDNGDKVEKSESSVETSAEENEVLSSVSEQMQVLNISQAKTASHQSSEASRKAEWAVMVDVSQPLSDFHQQVPSMAFTWPFELDTFQKQAVLRLERNESVFVAAHTSAGKTVVAEYAVALSQRHMTRTIYTSPIKALSNQKFRDFRDTFSDVGLVTGDIQINPSATCLIMTTEILRSMLYNGSDIVRDLEYVIFDEVHYINDAERGVVWEEVLILLPDHVNIIMLSATVPNTMEFAEWVGRTKRKKIYVISTPKRPVPLEHFLYTGDSGKTKDERFLILDSSGSFVKVGYDKAVAAKKARESKSKSQFGAGHPKQHGGGGGGGNFVNPKQEKNIWLTLVDHLSRNDKLPIVAFTLSRNRCDTNASLLTSLDLTTAAEKSEIHHFINTTVKTKLKEADRVLPQVLQLTELLKRGIGVHHSGILPILKEVVEMLFQRGWVKLLFATETFAMGINMPARTVVFDNIKKHDGTEFRLLKPAEYIQMAGRAGRRGLDSTGTVIILCKHNEVYPMVDLHRMMLSQPTRLESKFRLTYSMILNLLRVEGQLRVEDMIKRSFTESGAMQRQPEIKKKVSDLQTQLSDLPETTGPFHEELSTFYSLATDLLDLKDDLWPLVTSHPVAAKALVPGRVLVFTHGSTRSNCLGVLLSVDKSRSHQLGVVYSVLALGQTESTSSETSGDDRLSRILGLKSDKVTLGPEPSAGDSGDSHCKLEVAATRIEQITNKLIKVDAEKVLGDIKRREIPRFRDNPPGASTSTAITELRRYGDDLRDTCDWVPSVLDWTRDLKIQDIDLLTKMEQLRSLRVQIHSLPCSQLPDLAAQITPVYSRRSLEDEVSRLEYLLSEDSLKCLPDYNQRLEVLLRLGYTDEHKRVRLKGRVACEMGSRELLVTELVFDNLLTERPPEEIAALLSCMVFQQRNCSAPELTPSLEKGKAEIEKCAGMITRLQTEAHMKVPDFVDQLNFGLVEVVYEWARGLPFAQITNLTDVQEGVIVRTIQRLDEMLRDVKDAARVIGDPVLYQKMDTASTIIKRDIVFAASLYTQ